MFVHRIAGGHKGDHAAGSNLVERLGKKVVVNGKTELVVSPVVDLILAKGDIADGKVEEILPVGGFKARHGNVRLGIELLCDSAGDAVQLHTVQAASLHLLREKPEKIPDAHGRLQDVAGLEAHVANGFIDCLDNRGTGVVGVQGRCSGRSVFFGRKRRIKLRKFVFPVILAFIKSVRKPAPADVLGEDLLFLRGGVSALGFDLLQGGDCLDVAPEFLLCTACA